MKRHISLGAIEKARRFATLAVIDLDTAGTLLGVELLQASRVFGESIPLTKAASMLVRFDPGADALYVRIDEGVRATTNVCDAMFYLEDGDELVAIDLDWAPSE